MYRPGGHSAPGGSGPWRDEAGASYGQPPPQYQPRSGSYPGAGERVVDAGSGGGQRPSSGYRNTSYQRPPAAGRDAYSAYQEWAQGAPETPGDTYNGSAPPSSRSQAFRGAFPPAYQPGGQTWQQQPYAGAPAAYPGSQQGYDDPYGQYDQQEAPPRRSKKTALIVLLVIVLLAAVGGGAAYLFIGSRPTIAVTSKYMVGTTPAGATTTILYVSGSRFAAHSAVSILLDGQPEPGHEIFQSDASGAIGGNLTITSDWPLGQHSLTAKDASGSTTFQGKPIVIVAQGAANTPGPKGAPADDSSFTIHTTIHLHNKDTGQNSPASYVLLITGQPDPAGGAVCSSSDTGKVQTNKSTSNGLRVTETFIPTCSGTYKSGKIIYRQIFSNYKLAFSNGVTCTVPEPFINLELDGSFTSATSISGTVSTDTPTITCSNGNSVTSKGDDGTWAGSVAA